MMDAGVPMTRPVAGISIGLCTDHDDKDRISRYKLLTDIIGWEDAFCDMDCKIAGTEKGITGFQLDLKLRGIPHGLMAETVERARTARRHADNRRPNVSRRYTSAFNPPRSNSHSMKAYSSRDIACEDCVLDDEDDEDAKASGSGCGRGARLTGARPLRRPSGVRKTI